MSDDKSDVKLPLEYRWLVANGFKGFHPWYLIDENSESYEVLEALKRKRIAIRREYKVETSEDFYPIAFRDDCDDFAGYEMVDGVIQAEFITVHLTWTQKKELPGFPSRTRFRSMFDWVSKQVIPDTEEWMTEEDLLDLL